MGANCCVAVRRKPLREDSRVEVPGRSFRRSPSWSFRWDNRTHIEDMENSGRVDGHGGGGGDSDWKSGVDGDVEDSSSDGSLKDSFEKSVTEIEYGGGGSDQSTASNSSLEETEQGPNRSTASVSASNTSSSISVLSTPSSSVMNLGSSSSKISILPPGPTSSRQAHRSPGYQLSRHVSGSRIPSLQSLNENSSPEGRQSFVLSTPGNDYSLEGSHGRSSDGWSMRAFTELMASSQRDGWSFNSEYTGSIEGKLARSNSQSTVFSADMQTCGVCSKLLIERSSVISSNEIAVVAVLVCGHVCHADCLESVTSETDRFEPHCPVCSIEEKYMGKLGKDKLKPRSKISRIAVADVDEEFGSISACLKDGVKRSQIGASSSMKSSHGKPFFRRSFSLGPRLSRPTTENDTTRRKGFWAKYRRD